MVILWYIINNWNDYWMPITNETNVAFNMSFSQSFSMGL